MIAPYGTEKAYNALRMAMTLQKIRSGKILFLNSTKINILKHQGRHSPG